jgi:hypothetical protein
MADVTIYLLKDATGEPFYVGKTNNLKRRLKEHKQRFGYQPDFEILEVCGEEWPHAEAKWIAHFRILASLANKMAGDARGVQTHSEETRLRLSFLGKGKPKPDGFGEKIRAARKGRPQNWSPEGRERVEATQFRTGDNSLWQDASDEQKAKWLANLKTQPSEKISADLRHRWATMTPEQRYAIAAKRKLAWANMTPEQREARLAGIRGRAGTDAAKAKAIERKAANDERLAGKTRERGDG